MVWLMHLRTQYQNKKNNQTQDCGFWWFEKE